MLGGQPNYGWHLCFPLKLQAGGSDFRLYDSSDFKTYLLMRWQGPSTLAVVCFISFLYLDLYVLGDDALISKASVMQTKHLCVFIHI